MERLREERRAWAWAARQEEPLAVVKLRQCSSSEVKRSTYRGDQDVQLFVMIVKGGPMRC
jgi:hypothetical protein